MVASATVFTVASATGSPLDTGAAQAVGIASRAAALYRGARNPSISRPAVHKVIILLKQFRAIATRYDKIARNFLAAIHLAAATIWLN